MHNVCEDVANSSHHVIQRAVTGRKWVRDERDAVVETIVEIKTAREMSWTFQKPESCQAAILDADQLEVIDELPVLPFFTN